MKVSGKKANLISRLAGTEVVQPPQPKGAEGKVNKLLLKAGYENPEFLQNVLEKQSPVASFYSLAQLRSSISPPW
jgi:hypothetical protein